jgi:hypothetical protein
MGGTLTMRFIDGLVVVSTAVLLLVGGGVVGTGGGVVGGSWVRCWVLRERALLVSSPDQ